MSRHILFWPTAEEASGGARQTFHFGAPSFDADGQTVDKMLAPVNIDNELKPAKVNGQVANNYATKDPVMPTTFLSHPSIKTYNSKDINTNFDEAKDAKNIDDKD